MTSYDDAENAIDELKCNLDDLFDNKDDESYEILQKNISYLSDLVCEIGEDLINS